MRHPSQSKTTAYNDRHSQWNLPLQQWQSTAWQCIQPAWGYVMHPATRYDAMKVSHLQVARSRPTGRTQVQEGPIEQAANTPAAAV